MVDLTEEERAAVTATMQRIALLMEEIGWQTEAGRSHRSHRSAP